MGNKFREELLDGETVLWEGKSEPFAVLSGAYKQKLPVLWVYFLLCTDEFVKWPWVLRHYRSGAWAKNITREGLFSEEENASLSKS